VKRATEKPIAVMEWPGARVRGIPNEPPPPPPRFPGDPSNKSAGPIRVKWRHSPPLCDITPRAFRRRRRHARK